MAISKEQIESRADHPIQVLDSLPETLMQI